VFIEAKEDGGGDDNWTTGAINRAKLQSNHHHQQSNNQLFLQAGCPSCHPTNSVKEMKGKISHSTGHSLFTQCKRMEGLLVREINLIPYML